jgi:hypothetical protein
MTEETECYTVMGKFVEIDEGLALLHAITVL